MIRKELLERSPLRILEQSTHGCVGRGNIGVFAARKGVGKTACLVHVATDRLLYGKHVVHVSFADDPHHIIGWYENIFAEIARRNNLDDAMDVHDEIVRNRVIMNFKQDGIHISGIERSVRTLIESSHFSADTMVIDGYDFARSSLEELREFRSFAADLGLELWFSATVKPGKPEWDTASLPSVLATLKPEISIVICLRPSEGLIHLNLVKDHNVDCMANLHLKLDPQTLLIAEE